MQHTHLRAKRLHIHSYQEAIVYLHERCPVCLAEGLRAPARVLVTFAQTSIVATLHMAGEPIVALDEMGFSEYAWKLLGVREGDAVSVHHLPHLPSLGYVRSKIYGHTLSDEHMHAIVDDIVAGRLSDIYISAFLSACAGGRLDVAEILSLTNAMVMAGERLTWESPIVVDKHCVGGLPGNRTTPLVVPIVAEFGLLMPKTSSKAITSPAGTADTLSVLTKTDLSIQQIYNVVNQVGACMAWGGGVGLSPADDALISVERALNLDSEGQMIASVLSKKVAAGSTHVLIDIPIGPTAKVRSQAQAELFKTLFEQVGAALNLHIKVIFSDGTQPIGRGIGPALEARDVMYVLENHPDAPADLREKALYLAGLMIEFSPHVASGKGRAIAEEILTSGRALTRFKAICQAQGGLYPVPQAPYQEAVMAMQTGVVASIQNRVLSRIAALAGAPRAKVAGIDLHVKVGDFVEWGSALFTVCAQTQGELDYALAALTTQEPIITWQEAT